MKLGLSILATVVCLVLAFGSTFRVDMEIDGVQSNNDGSAACLFVFLAVVFGVLTVKYLVQLGYGARESTDDEKAR